MSNGGTAQALQRLESAIARIEGKLDVLIEALAEEDEEPERVDLDGQPYGRPGEPGQSLG